MSYGSPEWQSWVLPEEEAIKHIKYAYVLKDTSFLTTLSLILGPLQLRPRHPDVRHRQRTPFFRLQITGSSDQNDFSPGLLKRTLGDGSGQRDQEAWPPSRRARYHDQGVLGAHGSKLSLTTAPAPQRRSERTQRQLLGHEGDARRHRHYQPARAEQEGKVVPIDACLFVTDTRRRLSQHIFDSVKASLQRLQLDYIDVLQCK